MTRSDSAKKEVRAFEYNATEGVRAVAFLWFARRIFAPLVAFGVLCVVAAFAANGLFAASLCALIFGPPLYLLWRFTMGQGTKVITYWSRK